MHSWDAPIEIIIGTGSSRSKASFSFFPRTSKQSLTRRRAHQTAFLYSLIGYAALIGIAVAVLFLPLNNWCVARA